MQVNDSYPGSSQATANSLHAQEYAGSNISLLPPLVVDLDGTLTRTDTLVESVLLLIKQHPINLLKLPFLVLKGAATFKQFVASRVTLPVVNLPWRTELIEFLRAEKAEGRQIVLATAAHKSIADAVAAHLNIFDTVLATERGHNLKGTNKLAAIKENCSSTFVYAGDSRADIPIWKEAKAAILVDVNPRIANTIRNEVPIEKEFVKEKSGFGTWLRALRMHQWVKNLLLFVPLLMNFSFLEFANVAIMLVAFVAFSLAASATYIANDLWDLENDRAHPRKQARPFASGKKSILKGIGVATGALTIAIILAAFVSYQFLLMLFVYIALTTSYSWIFKEYVLIDVLMLSLLYTLRILSGSIVIGVTTSSWLLAFSVFVFLSLALVKRCSELVSLDKIGSAATQGRDYRVTDLVVLWPLGVGAALSAIVVFGLFISTPETQVRYGSPQLLWIVAIGLIYWLARLWIKTSRGEMHDDPVIFAIKDSGSCITLVVMTALIIAAHFFTFNIF